MSTALVVNGRIVAASGALNGRRGGRDYANHGVPYQGPVVRDPETGQLVDVAPEPMTYTPGLEARPGVPWKDEDGTVYRVVSKINAAEGWVIAETIMGWYKVPYEVVALWVQKGLLDGVREAASPTKVYRVLDPTKVHNAAVEYRASKRRKR